MRETTFRIVSEIPRTKREKHAFSLFIKTLFNQTGYFGERDLPVGVGYVWYTKTGLADAGLTWVRSLSRSLIRALRSGGLISHGANVYLLESRIAFTRDEPYGIINIREGVKE